MAQIHFPRALSALIPGLPSHTECQAATVQDLIAHLDQQWPGVRMCLCATYASLRPHINVYVDNTRAALETPVQSTSIVRVLMAVSGG